MSIIPEYTELAHGLLATEALQFVNPLEESSHRLFRVDLDRLQLVPGLGQKAVDAYAAILIKPGLAFTPGGSLRFVVGTKESAPRFHAVNERLGLRRLYRTVVTDGGDGVVELTKEPQFEAEDEVAILDNWLDVPAVRHISDQLADDKLVVTWAVALLESGLNEREKLLDEGIHAATVFKLGDLAKYALEHKLGGMTPRLYDDLMFRIYMGELALDQ